MDETYDVVIVGGGAAGLAGATALARFRRSVLVIDAGDPRNGPAAHVHNVLGHDGTPPAELYAAARTNAEAYGAVVERAPATAVRVDGDGFAVVVGGRTVGARRVLVTTDARDVLPDVPGLADRWGSDVLHCPYCHGFEVADRRVGVLVTSPMSYHQALLFRALTPALTVLTHTGPAPTDEQAEQLAALGVAVVGGEVTAVESGADGLTGVRLADGTQVGLDALVVAPRVHARADLLAPLGLAPVLLVVNGVEVGTRVEAEPTGATVVPGLYVAGNVTDLMAQVVTSAAAGLMAAAALNGDLIAADTAAAVQRHRYERVYGEAAWEERYRASERNWSGEPNAVLVDEVTALTPGTVLDAGAGEGGDALWLAARGWTVTATDLSTTALARGRAEAERQGLDVTWLHADLTATPPPGTYDLVSAFYLHLPVGPRRRLLAHLAAAVAPGGTLLVVGHDLSDDGVVPRPALREMGWTAPGLAAELAETSAARWTVEVAEARPRTATHPEGHPVVIHDAVLRARRTV